MTKKIEIECPNCTDPLAITPDQLGLAFITCDNCATQLEGELVREAVKKKMDSDAAANKE